MGGERDRNKVSNNRNHNYWKPHIYKAGTHVCIDVCMHICAYRQMDGKMRCWSFCQLLNKHDVMYLLGGALTHDYVSLMI